MYNKSIRIILVYISFKSVYCNIIPPELSKTYFKHSILERVPCITTKKNL